MDIDSLAQALFGGKRAEEQEVETNATTRTYMGVAVSDSSDGTVRVDLGGDVTLPDDLYDEDGNVVSEWDGAGIEMSTSPQVREGQDVIVTLVGGTSTKRPMVTAAAGEGDTQAEAIDEAARAAEVAWNWADDAHVAAAQAQEDAEAAALSAASAASSASDAASSASTASASAQQAVSDASTAATAATNAQTSAANAESAAQASAGSASAAATSASQAQASAGEARTSAQEAQASARSANASATAALNSLSTVEDVVDTLTWITEHGTMAKTTDTAVDPSKVYFVRDNNGDYTVGDNRYSIVQEPVASGLSSYYELTIDKSVENYIATHLSVTNEGLWLTPTQSGGYRVLVATGGAGKTYPTAGTYIIDGSGATVAQFTGTGISFADDRTFYIGDESAYIFFDGNGHINIGGSNVTIGGSTTLAELLAKYDATITSDDISVSKTGGTATITVGGDSVTISDGAAGAQGPKGDTGDQGPQGPKGDQGETGPQGPAGKGISSIIEYYALSNSTSAPSDSSFSTGVKTPTASNRYVWNYELITYTDSSTFKTAKHIAATYGETGSAGKGISSIVDYYAVNNSTTAPADSAFSTTISNPTATNRYLWNYELTTYSDTSTAKTSKRIIGVYGEKGETGETGPQGPAGHSPAITTSKNSDGSVTIYVDGTATSTVDAGEDGSTPTVTTTKNSDGSVTIYVNGTASNTVEAGADGTSYYTYVRYSANANGSGMVTTPTSATKYIGVYTGTSSSVPAYTSFKWSKYVGEDGSDADPLTVTSHDVDYQLSTSGTTAPTGNWSTTPLAPTTTQYLWTRTTLKFSDNTESVSYSVGGKAGTNGENGTNGTNGTDGGRWYAGTKITGTSTTATVFSGSGITAAVVGDMYLNTSTYNTYRCTVAGNASTAKWVYTTANIKGQTGSQGPQGETGPQGPQGPQGETGPQGPQGETGSAGSNGVSVTGVEHQYYLSTSSTSQTGGSWTVKPATYVRGRYYWERWKVSFSSGNPTYTTATLAEEVTSAWTAIESNDEQIALKANSSDVYTKSAVDGKITQEVTDRTAAITAKANEINLEVSKKVGKDEVISSINLTEESATINASKINLVGAVTIGDLASDAQDVIYQSAQPNLTPFFEVAPTDTTYWFATGNLSSYTTRLENGWSHVELSNLNLNVSPRVGVLDLSESTTYTVMLEVRNAVTLTNCRLSIYTATNSTWSASKNIVVAANGTYYITGVTKADLSSTDITHLRVFFGSDTSTANADIRLSLYEGEYSGPYKPYNGGQLYAHKSDVAWTGTCDTAAGTAAKEVICDGFTASELTMGATICVRFNAANTSSAALTLNVNGTGVKPISVATGATSATNQLLWASGATIRFMYNTSLGQWRVADTTPTYYSTCSVGEGVAAKTAGCAGCVIFKGVAIHIIMTAANTNTSATLNVNSTGAKAIYYGNTTTRPTTANEYGWKAGATASFVFDGAYWRYADASAMYQSADAAKTASNYITTIDANNGIKIANASPSSATTYLQLASNFLDFIRGGVSMLKAWVDGTTAKVRVGAESGFNTLTDGEGIKLRNGTTVLGQFATNLIELGKNSTDAVIKFCGGLGEISADSNGAVGFSSLTNDDTGFAGFQTSVTNGKLGVQMFASESTENSFAAISLWPKVSSAYDVPSIVISSDGDDHVFPMTDFVNSIPVTLYDNNSASASAATTLSESAANFKRLTIFYKDTDNTYSSVDVWNPNGKRVSLDLTWINGASTQQMYQRVRWVTISGTTISTAKDSSDSKYRTGQVCLSGSYSVTNSDYISIVHVIGYR